MGINCGSDCAEAYPSSTFVKLTASPSVGTTFTGWSGACTGGSCQLTMDGAKSVTANFVLTPSNLIISAFSASPANVSVNGTVNLAATVRNVGAGSSRTTTLRYYYWTGSVWSEITFCPHSVGPLASGATSSQSCAIIPSRTPGTFYYYVAVDPFAGESVTTDNLAADYVTFTVNIGAGAGNNYEGLWWNAPAGSESGWGINFAHQGDTIFASWFTYDQTGKAWWLVMTASKTAPNTYSGTLFQVTGPPYDEVPFPPQGSPGSITGSSVGTGTLTFTDNTNGAFTYMVNGISQTKAITRETFGPLPTCTFGSQSNLAVATNYQDLWWAAPAASEAGWGINLTHEGDTIFATWFTFDHDRTPMWLVVTASKTGPTTYSGDLIRLTRGPPFNSVPFPPIGSPGGATGSAVGTAIFSFTNGNAGRFAYSINGITQSKAITREVFTAPGTICQ